MLNLPIIYRALGLLLQLESLMLALCFGLGFWFHETHHLTFGIPVVVALVLGALLRYKGRGAENRLSLRDGYLIVSLTWIVVSLVGMLPFLIGGYQPRIAAAFFESMSGFTTTGATTFVDVDALPRSILLWRSLSHWVGGMGIVFFTIAILPNIGGTGMKLFSAETTGLKLGKLHPRIGTTARWVWSVYLFLTLSCMAAYYFGGMTLFDAVNHGLSTIGTGGFSTHTESIAWFHSERLTWIATAFMFLAGINCTLLYLLIIKRRWRAVIHDDELRYYVGILLTVALAVALILHFAEGLPVWEALRSAVFNVVSLQTTTGFTDTDFMGWHPTVWLLLTAVSVIGACAGSTSGGLKCVRILTVWRITKAQFQQMVHPHAVIPMRVGGTQITPQTARTVIVFFVSFLLLVGLGTFLMVAMGLPLLDALGLALSSFSNIGPCVGHAIGPLHSWHTLNDATLWLNSFLMLAGRLEVFSLLLPLTPSFWRAK